MRSWYVRIMETLKEHSRSLVPLYIGDNMLVQNQSGNSPGKWDRSGIVVESKGHDQYVVKVAGTGRLTLRNCCFLRVFTPRFPQGSIWKFERPSSPTNKDNHTVLLTHSFALQTWTWHTNVKEGEQSQSSSTAGIKTTNCNGIDETNCNTINVNLYCLTNLQNRPHFAVCKTTKGKLPCTHSKTKQ